MHSRNHRHGLRRLILLLLGSMALQMSFRRWAASFQMSSLTEAEVAGPGGLRSLGRRVVVQSVLDAPPDRVWELVKQPATFARVVSPLIGFSVAGGRPLPQAWRLNETVSLNLRGFGPGYEVGDERRFGQIAPVFLRHLLLHRLRLEASRVEDVLVIGAPELLGGVFRRRVTFVRTRRESEILSVPVSAQEGREDGPANAGEAANEEGCVALDDEMLRLEPGDIALTFAIADFAEADEGTHLVDVAPH